MLEDLQAVLQDVNVRIGALSLDVPFAPQPEVWEEVCARYAAQTSDAVFVVGNALAIRTPNGNFLTISGQELPRIWAVLPYVLALQGYEAKVDELARAMGFPSRSSGRGKDEIFKKLPSDEWRTLLSTADVAEIDQHISQSLNLSPVEQGYFKKFLEDKEWSGVSKTLERGDWRMAAIVGAGRWLANAATRRGELADALSTSTIFASLMTEAVAQASMAPTISTETGISQSSVGGRNLILYGAPGTGKSHLVDNMVKGAIAIRTVFHADTQNSDFFGCLKPSMKDDKVVYGFVPGPFAKALVQAKTDPVNHHYLIIEELNRAPAAAVFGELFQLLDRDDNGQGIYAVDFPTKESEIWFKDQGYGADKLVLPQNLSIYATMNSADQGVFPLDTAFRRRWEQEYLALADGDGPDGTVSVVVGERLREVTWKSFVCTLNDYLLETVKPPEDRLLGLWFVKGPELGKGNVPPKVMLYLVDDLLRHEDKSLIFADGMFTYGQIAQAMKAQPPQQVFSSRFVERLTFMPLTASKGDRELAEQQSEPEVD